MRSAVAPVLCALSILGCGPGRDVAPPPAPPVAPPARPSGARFAVEGGGGGEATAASVVAEMLETMARLRQLDAKGSVKSELLARDAIAEKLRADIEDELPDAVLAGQEELLVALGVVPVDFDYLAATLELFGSELAGFYDPRTRTMFLLGDLSSGEAQATLAHELVHALQDQHYDLGARIKYRDDAGDEQSALHALAEGDATSAMLDEILASRGLTALDVADDLVKAEARASIEIGTAKSGVPGIVKRSVIAPYLDGLDLVHWARRHGGWPKVDEIWRDPPRTTEQLLHPEKLVAREPAEAIDVPPAPPGGPTTVLYHDVIGEQSVRLLFEEWLPSSTAAASAAGWGGDRAAVMKDGDRTALVWHLRYDDESGARAALGAFVRKIRAGAGREPYAAKVDVPKSGEACQERPSLGPLAVRRSGRDLAIVAGPYRRANGAAKSDGRCSEALAWVRTVLAAH